MTFHGYHSFCHERKINNHYSDSIPIYQKRRQSGNITLNNAYSKDILLIVHK